jgi:hypothetical protein
MAQEGRPEMTERRWLDLVALSIIAASLGLLWLGRRLAR